MLTIVVKQKNYSPNYYKGLLHKQETGVLIFILIDCQVKCNKINEKIYKALRGEYENQGVYGDDY